MKDTPLQVVIVNKNFIGLIIQGEESGFTRGRDNKKILFDKQEAENLIAWITQAIKEIG